MEIIIVAIITGGLYEPHPLDLKSTLVLYRNDFTTTLTAHETT